MPTVPRPRKGGYQPSGNNALTGKHPALESLIRTSGLVCNSCGGTGDGLPPGLLLEKCEECNGTGQIKKEGK
jgi:hypothetical protein